ncbi:MAG: MBL fold metallo-hydrolase [Bdellovibrionales bacterium]|nr:MBL fold metallo-hydrolase [Bdellovibrionales bacterium]
MKNMIFRQLFDQDSWTFTYLLADPLTKEAIMIDPVYEKAERDLTLIRELDLKLKYTIETHTHADHITGAAKISAATGAKKVAGKQSGAVCADILVDDGDTLEFGPYIVKCISTPGHTDGCMSYYVSGSLFTGDALFVRGNGRTDFQQGSPERLFESITQKIYSLPDETIIYPAHDYKGHSFSTVEEEKKFNPRINETVTLDQFVKTMNGLNLPDPKKIHEAVPANLVCGNV